MTSEEHKQSLLLKRKHEERRDITGFLKTATRMLMILSLALLVYIVANVFFLKEERPLDVSQKTAVKVEYEKAGDIILPEGGSFQKYAGVIEERDIFKLPYGQKPLVKPGSQTDPAPAVTVSLTKNFKLVGIVLDKNPQAVIEDIQKKETLFISRGEQIDGAVLEEIQEGKVIFRYQNQLIELIPE